MHLSPTGRDIVPSAERAAIHPATSGNVFRFYHDGATNAAGSQGAFADIEQLITGARHFVFIADWSFHAGVQMQRGSQRRSIGELLIEQAHEYPNLLIAVMSWLHISAATGDTDNNSAGDDLQKLNADLGHRSFPSNLLWRASPYGRTNTFSHHQKFVVADVPTDRGEAEAITAAAFFGGLDLTKGRFDWPDHPLDDTADHTFVHDWYNAEFGHDPTQVRQPWHDVHARVDGPVAWQIADEFTARWAAPGQYYTLGLSPKGDDGSDHTEAVTAKRAAVDQHRSTNSDHGIDAQLLHSINRDAWTVPAPAGGCGERFKWPLRKHHERSIQDAYLALIAEAENFIYIETQYFIGSGSQWANTRYGKARPTVENEVPEAIVARILERWRAGAPFHVVVVLPMFPEGNPGEISMRAIRSLQWCTIEYVVNALHAEMAPSGDAWQDWISFSFLANWGRGGGEGHKPTGNERFDRVRASSRYMTYVHSKAMIVDDRAAIIGSANLNERSLNGNRDSEIAVAIRGDDVAASLSEFRRDLLTEHLGPAWMSKHGHLPAGGDAFVRAFRQSTGSTFTNFMRNVGSVENGQLARWPIETDGQRIRFEDGEVDDPAIIPDAPSTDRADWAWFPKMNMASEVPLAGRLFE